jgi:hypothetical protein
MIHHFIRNVIAHGLKVMLNRDFALGGQFLDFLSTLGFPVFNISVGTNTEGTSLIFKLVKLLGK